MAHWILQSNIYAEEGYEAFTTAVTRLGLPLTTVKVVPFVGELEATSGALPAQGADAVVMGSYTLARVAKRMGWRPGAFLDNLDFEVQRERWGDRMLNHDAEISRFRDVRFRPEPFFIRPVHDTKAFTGFVCDWGEYLDWRDSLIRLPETADPVNDPLGVNLMGLDTPVMACRQKLIYGEWRTWVVGGRVVTASGYKVGTMKRYTPPEQVSPGVIEFAQDCADRWSPNDAYVLDVATVEGPHHGGLRIVEVNNLNSAGFYRGDMQRVVMAIEDLGRGARIPTGAPCVSCGARPNESQACYYCDDCSG